MVRKTGMVSVGLHQKGLQINAGDAYTKLNLTAFSETDFQLSKERARSITV